MKIIRKNPLFAALIISAFCTVPLTADACDVGDLSCLLELEQDVPVQAVAPEAPVKENDTPDVSESDTEQREGDESAAMTEVDGYYEVDIENGGFYYFE